MDGFTWLLLSWLAVGAFCYFVLQKMGATDTTASSTLSGAVGEKTATIAESTATHVYSADGSSLVHRPSPGVRHDYSNHQPPRINVEMPMDPRRASGQDKWVNDFVAWLFNNYKGAPEAANAWLRSLNDAAKKVTAPTNCEVLFEGFGDHSNVHDAPKLRNIRVEPGPRDHLTFRSEVDVPAVHLKLVSSQRLHDRLLVSNYDARLVDLHGEVQVRIACIANELFLMGCFNGRPEMDVQLVSTDSNAVGRVDASLVEDAIRRCLVSAVTNVTLSGARGHGTSSADNDSDHHRQSSLATSPPVEEMFRRLQQAQTSPKLIDGGTPPNKLRVKVIRAQRLGGNIDVHQPFVVVEMDDPPKKYATTKGLNMSPYWEETFEFELAPTSEEILFEAYEGSTDHSEHPNRFLGLAIVGFEEIRRSGESVHSLTLQGRPYRNDEVSGTVTVEFEFYHDPSIAAIGKRVESVIVRNSQGQFTETIAVAKRPLYDPHDNYENHDVMAVPTKTTTVLIKSVSQYFQQPNERSVEDTNKQRHNGSLDFDSGAQHKDNRAASAKLDESVWTNESRLTASEYKSQTREHGSQPPLATAYTIARSPPHSVGGHAPQINVNEQPVVSVTTHDRGRSTERKEGKSSFFGELRDRLSGKHVKRRPHSVDIGSAASSQLEETMSVPASRDASETRAGARSRSYYETSSVGARSGDSSRSLYQHSTLVVELLKNNVRKYYLIPPAVIAEPAAAKLMKRGKKLHIFNEHTFVAVRIRGGTVCNVCSRRIGRSFSKQAYQCRDCRMLCHKTCHYKTDTFCSCSNVSNLQITKDIDWARFLTYFQMEEYISADGV